MDYLAGEWRPAASGEIYERLNPADATDQIGVFPESGPADSTAAAEAAAETFGAWSAESAQRRAEIVCAAAASLRERVAMIAADLTREEGKPLGRARGEVLRAADALEYFAAAALQPDGRTVASTRPGVSLSTVSQPVGPALLITPFNFPLFVTALKLGPALTAGNTVIWKPSPHTPLTSIALMQAFIDGGIPRGVMNMVLGGSVELGRSLVGDERIAAISFTGSTKVGIEIGRQAAARHARVQQEMGGKNMLAVAPDFELRRAAELACESAFGESGQKCTAAGIVVVDQRRADEFLHEVRDILSGWTIGDGLLPATVLGPVVDGRAQQRATALVGAAVSGGATVVAEGCGATSSALDRGHFMQPVVLRMPAGPNPLKTEEAFAPIMTMVVAADVLEESLSLVAESRMGLSASILTHDLALAQDFCNRVPAGLVNVNLPTTGVEYQAPFGGWNMSGGAFPEAGPNAASFYTRVKTVAVSV